MAASGSWRGPRPTGSSPPWTQARHGHKTAAHGLDGDKAHVAIDPDVEVICAAEVSPAATGDAAVAPRLLGDLVQGQGGLAAQAVV